jgi:hypothetical protein
MFIQYPLKQQSRRELHMNYQFMQIPQEYSISEVQIHLNSLQIR